MSHDAGARLASDADGSPDEDVHRRVASLVHRLDQLTVADEFEPAVPALLVSAGFHLLAVPRREGGFGLGTRSAVGTLARLGAVDGSAALGLAMHTTFVGGVVGSTAWPAPLRAELMRSIAVDGALVNSAASEERTGSPARGGLPDTRAELDGDGWRISGEKTWTTWLPALRHALVSARMDTGDGGELRIGQFLVDLVSPGISRRVDEDTLGMRGSASGRLLLDRVQVPADRLVAVRRATEPDPRGPAHSAWFALCVAGTYLGIGEGARDRVARWALDRRPADGTAAVADIPSVQMRLGRADGRLRAARIVLLDVATRWDAAGSDGYTDLSGDIALAKLTATAAAVEATDEALRIAGGPGFVAGRLERAFRDSRAGLINPPLDDVAHQAFARAVLDRVRTEIGGTGGRAGTPLVASSARPSPPTGGSARTPDR